MNLKRRSRVGILKRTNDGLIKQSEHDDLTKMSYFDLSIMFRVTWWIPPKLYEEYRKHLNT